MVRAFLERPLDPLWWLGLIGGILMTGLAFWTSGQFFIEKAYVLLVFAGIWALMEGTAEIVQAFALEGCTRSQPRHHARHGAAPDGAVAPRRSAATSARLIASRRCGYQAPPRQAVVSSRTTPIAAAVGRPITPQ